MLTALAQATLLHQEGKQGGLKKADSGLAGRLETATQARVWYIVSSKRVSRHAGMHSAD